MANEVTQAVWPVRSGRELYFSGSGSPIPSPSTEEIAAAIRKELAIVLGNDTFGEPVVNAALKNAAIAAQNLFLASMVDRSNNSSLTT